ncbi:hypothetical protein ACFOW6_04485 [Fodinicurvata halophila]|uniref:Uncharacterized protein n=1 Tax=Fodinicurvata halophila TaxID=1419723 RepID=A0ABV8UHQ0_9PROT
MTGSRARPVRGPGWWCLPALGVFVAISTEPLGAAEGAVVFRNTSGERLELHSQYGDWHRSPVEKIPAQASSHALVQFPDNGVVVQSLGYAFANDRGSYCQVRVATVPGPAGCEIELTPVNRDRMDCFARTTRRDRESCAFEVDVEIAPARSQDP